MNGIFRAALLLGFSFSVSVQAELLQTRFDELEYESLLAKMIGVSKQLQNHPEKGLIPTERLVADIVMNELEGLVSDDALPGKLTVQDLDYSNGKRPNLILTYHGTNPEKVISFMGSHFDVVPANPSDKEWGGRNPFALTKERDEKGYRLYGRGVTDCLGHVAMLTHFLKRLAQEKPKLEHSVAVVFIANEEVSRTLGIGIDEVYRHGHLDGLKNGSVYWLDSADTLKFGPRLGTGGLAQFHFKFSGKSCHSGYPGHGINPITLQSRFMCQLDDHFTQFFTPKKQLELDHLFKHHSSCKATQVLNGVEGTLSQVTSECKLGGDIRYSPFWETTQVKQELEDFVSRFNARVESEDFSPTQSGSFTVMNAENRLEVGRVTLEWQGEPAPAFLADRNGPEYRHVVEALRDITGRELIGFSATGTLPLISEMKAEGFKIVPLGFGLSTSYHAPGEYGYLEDFAVGFNVVERLVERHEQAL